MVRAGQEGELGDHVVEMSLSRSEPGDWPVRKRSPATATAVAGVNAEPNCRSSIAHVRSRDIRTVGGRRTSSSFWSHRHEQVDVELDLTGPDPFAAAGVDSRIAHHTGRYALITSSVSPSAATTP